MTTRRRARLSPKTGAGIIRHLKLTFPAKYSPNPKMRFNQLIQILEQLCDQCNEQIPAFVWEPIIPVISRELKMVLRARLVHGDLTQKGNISVIHAHKDRTFGKRYTLQIDPGHSSISVVVAGSNELYDLLIDINQEGNLLLSFKGMMACPRGKKLVELQLATMPSDHDSDNNIYMYSLSYNKPAFKKTVTNNVLLKTMEFQLRQLSLTPELYAEANNGKDIQKITSGEFEEMFGVKLVRALSVAIDNDDGHDDSDIRNLRNISSSYRKLRPYIDGQLAYEAGIKNGSLLGVSQESLLGTIISQIKKKKKQYLPKVVIVRINDLVGYGLVAGEYISAGTIIGEYCGEISKIAGLDKGRKEDNTYFAAYAPDEVPGSEMFVIDAKKKGNSTRFINHSDENSNAAWAHVFDGSKFRLVIAAVKPILKGKQVLLKYRRSYWSTSNTPNPCPL